jgi:hypothetical protein
MFSNSVAASYTKTNSALSNEGGDICCREENEGDGEILDERNVES